LLLKTEEQQLALVGRQDALGNAPTLMLGLWSAERLSSYLVSCTGRNENEPKLIEQFPDAGLVQPLKQTWLSGLQQRGDSRGEAHPSSVR